MDDGDIQLPAKLSDNAMLLIPESSSDFQALTCTHTHTCNPPGPDSVHTHTCYHPHTQVFASEEDDKGHTKSKARPSSSNREAFRKYREKAADTGYLEEEVKRLHLQHVQLVRKLQKQAILEAELSRLRSILIDFRRKIDNELGVFPPYKKQCTSHGQTNFPCFHSPHAGSSSQVAICGTGKFSARWEGNFPPAIVDCQVNVDKKASKEEDEESIEGDG